MKKIVTFFLTFTLLMSLILTGCSSPDSGKKGKGEPSKIEPFRPNLNNIKYSEYPPNDDKTFKFLNINVSLPVPQTYYMFDKGFVNQELKDTGYKAVELMGDEHEQVLPNLYNGYYDFAYISVTVLTEYWSGQVLCEKERWKKGDEYVIIAGDYDGGIYLVTGPGINSLKDLDGKKVGIMNMSYNLEMQFNKMLSENGLKTRALGGTVDVVHNFPGNIMNNLSAGKLSATFVWDRFSPQLKTLGFKEMRSWDQMGYGQDAPNMVLAVRRDILEQHPEVVERVLRAHVKATQEANKSQDFQEPLITKTIKHDTGLGRKQRLKNSYHYDSIRITYDPHAYFLKDTFEYMEAAKVFKKRLKFEELVDLSLLNKVLAQEKLTAVKE